MKNRKKWKRQKWKNGGKAKERIENERKIYNGNEKGQKKVRQNE